ncbi:DUF1015 domain-containing protein [Streptomyces sp. SL13]|uniref:DUF1015 domain-containing protein n=1 Tax=Streptantibioticus silvisoli TaxID=2705255 RepID=A0AA90H0E1_9ACTN|nr:DUF1015 domain-containing protein [Streptantibioticus silvisoli]MDI5971688.1 DUF1015 domain-containing protein [Streptantibioticus silvisoli]
MSTPASPASPRGLRLTPFRGLRYDPDRVGSLSAVTSPPYDVVVRPDGLQHLETADPFNIVRLILPQAGDPAARHTQAAHTLRDWLADGILATDPVPSLYVYEQRGPGGELQRGLIGALRLTTPDERVVLPHEAVMPGPVVDRAELMRTTAANLEPLLLVYRGDGPTYGDDGADNGGDAGGNEGDGERHGSGAAAAAVERYATLPPLLVTTTEDGVRHRLWAVTDPAELAAIDADLSRRQALIADGHHRWATYLLLRDEQPPHTDPGPWDHGLVLLVDSDRYPLTVRAIHRVLQRLPIAKALAAVRTAFDIEEVPGPLPDALKALAHAVRDGDNAFLLSGDGPSGAFYLLTGPDDRLLDASVPRGRPESWRRLDTTVLHSVLIDRVWRVPDAPEYLGYVHDTTAAIRQAHRLGGTAVLMHPVEENTVLDLARQGVMMPPKSTSFGPKPASGLVLRSLTAG